MLVSLEAMLGRFFNYKFRQTTLLTIGCLSFLVGLALARRVEFTSWPFALMVTVSACLLFRRKTLVVLLLLVIAGLLGGLWRGAAYMEISQRYQALFRQPIVLQVQAESDAIYGQTSQLDFDASHVTVAAPYQQKLPGKIKVEGFGVPMVYRGDVLELKGSLSQTRGSNQARMSYATITLKQRGGSPIDTVRRRFTAAMQSVLPEPQASFGAGILIGQRSTIPEETNEQLSITGLTHIVAVSGYNLTIIVVAVRQLLGKRSKFQSAVGAALLMLAFILITGFSASIVRAALVSSFSLLAWYYGRTFKPLLLISLAAALTAGWNPFYLWSDLGWYLSFIAFFGVLVIAPLTIQLVSKRDEPKLLATLLTETIAAQIVTLPLIMYIFGRVSLIGLLANILVVPLVPLAMLLTLVGGLAGMWLAPIAGWLAWPSRILLVYMLDITALLSRVPHASAEQYINVGSMVGLYAATLVVVLLLRFKVHSKKRLKDATITE